MTARLHVLLGGGGVGKTTLAAAYAIALSRRGGRVGLLGIDPSRRLQDAIGIRLGDLEVPVPGHGLLRAAVVSPQQAMRRWVVEGGHHEGPPRLRQNPLFEALGDRLATATDLLAAARIAEWAEHDPELTDLVVDTAPGLAAIDFLTAPTRLLAIAQFPLRLLAISQARPAAFPSSWRRAARVLVQIGGDTLAGQILEFLALVHEPLLHLFRRVERARAWLSSDRTELLLVTSPRDGCARAAAELAVALGGLGLSPRAVVVNRTLPARLERELGGELPPEARPLAAHVRNLLRAQAGVIAAARSLAPLLVELPSTPAIQRLDGAALAGLGETFASALSAPPARRKASS